MSKHNPNEISTLYGTPESVYNTLKDYLARRIVNNLPFTPVQIVTFAGNNVPISSDLVSGSLSIGVNSINHIGGIFCAALSGAFGTGSLETLTNSQGFVVNQVEIRPANSTSPLIDIDNKKVFGLLQAKSGTADGSAVGASGNENLRLTLFKYNTANTYTLVNYVGDIEFTINRIYSELALPNLRMEGGVLDVDVLVPPTNLRKQLYVFSALEANEIINITTGATSINGAGTCGVTGDSTLLLPTTNNAFINSNKIEISRNGVIQSLQNGDVTWLSPTEISFPVVIDAQEVIIINAPSSY